MLHLLGRLHYIFSHCFVFTWNSDVYVTQLLDYVIQKSILVLHMLPFALWYHAKQALFVALLHSTHGKKDSWRVVWGIHVHTCICI